jgi:hypothetical protein
MIECVDFRLSRCNQCQHAVYQYVKPLTAYAAGKWFHIGTLSAKCGEEPLPEQHE